MIRTLALLSGTFCLSFNSLLIAADDDGKKQASAGELKIPGVFESLDQAEISFDTDHVESLEIKRIVPHGSEVSRGETIVWFKTDDLDEKIEEAETDLRLARLELEQAEQDHEHFQETQRLDRAAAERTRKRAQQNYDQFMQVDRQRMQEQAEFNVKSSLAALENAEEELKQLRQMYEADDLTEESEEIVLKRAKRSVEFAQFRLKGTRIESDRTTEQTIPRKQADQEDALQRAEVEYHKKMSAQKTAREKQEIELERQRKNFREQETDLEELKEFRRQTVLTAPIDGILLHGELDRGRLSDKPSQLEAGSKVARRKTIATVVNPRRLQIRVNLEQKQLAEVAVGDTCAVRVAGLPERELEGEVKSISDVPYAGTKFDCVVDFSGTRATDQVMPTMGCELVFEVEQTAEEANAEAKDSEASKEGEDEQAEQEDEDDE